MGEFVKTIKIVCIGDGATGKSCLLTTFATSKFPQEYVPTIFDNFSVTMDSPIGNEKIKVEIWDTAGQADFDDVRSLGYHDVALFLICFSFHDPDSLTNVYYKWKKELDKFFSKSSKSNVPIVVCGCKSDLKGKIEKGAIEVEKKQIDQIIKLTKPHAYYECSALENKGLKELFNSCLKISLTGEREIQDDSSNCVIL